MNIEEIIEEFGEPERAWDKSQSIIATENSDTVTLKFYQNFSNSTDKNQEAAYIYALSSISNAPKISTLRNLYKIGYSTKPAANRIKNSEKEPTYLIATVHAEAECKTFNRNNQKFKQLIHNFSEESSLNIDIYDDKLRLYMPQEWLVAPLKIAYQAI